MLLLCGASGIRIFRKKDFREGAMGNVGKRQAGRMEAGRKDSPVFASETISSLANEMLESLHKFRLRELEQMNGLHNQPPK